MSFSLRVGIYSRVSTDKQDSENQLVQLREFATRQGWQLTTEYIDQGQSGSKSGNSRPEFAQMMKDTSQRKFDLLLFWSLDRLSREGVSQTLDYLNRLSSWGVGFRSFSNLISILLEFSKMLFLPFWRVSQNKKESVFQNAPKLV